VNKINDITLLTKLKSLQPSELQRQKSVEGAKKDGPSFQDVMKKAIEDVSGLEKEADQAITKLVEGRSDNIHEAMIALQKADLSFRAMMEVRDKLISAYKEVMRTTV